MRILHLSDSNLPDWRIEKAALSSKKKDYEVYFAGTKSNNNYLRNTFIKVYHISWNPKVRYKIPIYWNNVKKQMINVIKEVRPDIIHAHNIFAAKMVKEIGGDYPFVYDNHEYWSKFLIYQYESIKDNSDTDASSMNINLNMTKIMNFVKKKLRKMWIKWEKEIVSEIPTIVPSNSIVSDLCSMSHKVYLLPNYPMENEIEYTTEPKIDRVFSSVYAGTAPYQGVRTPIKNIDGFIELFESQDIGKLNVMGWKAKNSENVIYHGFLDRKQMLSEMMNNSIGIIPWKKHHFHKYCNPNKAYEYAHAGLLVFSTCSLEPVFDGLKSNIIGFNNYAEMVGELKYFKSHPDELYKKRLKTYEFARKNLLWENYEDNIFDAYKSA